MTEACHQCEPFAPPLPTHPPVRLPPPTQIVCSVVCMYVEWAVIEPSGVAVQYLQLRPSFSSVPRVGYSPVDEDRWSADEELSRPRKLSGIPYPSLERKSVGQPRGEYKDQYDDDYVCRKLVLLLDLASSSSACSVRLSVCASRRSHNGPTDSR